MEREKRTKIICCVLFLLTLCLFWIADIFCGDRIYSDWEKRMLAQKPEFGLVSLADGSYGSEYEEWMTDQFPGRSWWVSLKTRCELLLGKREIRGIYLGRDHYMFAESTQTADWDRLEAQMQEQFGEEKVSRIHVPAAGAVLEERLPRGLAFSHELDRIRDALRLHSEEYIYYRTDHHWTMLGAYYAYAVWIEEQGMQPLSLDSMPKKILKADFLGTHYGKIHYAGQADMMEFYDPGIACTVYYDLGETEEFGLYQEKYLETEDAYGYFLDGNHGLVQIRTGQQGGHLAVLKDSFANCLIPFLTAHYGKITVIDPRYFRADISVWLREQNVTQILILAQDTTEVL